jgi:RimJ/RimL family protein N-acetyltransferase
MLKLVDVYTEIAEMRPATKFLYELLKERETHQNISHREMPSYEDHVRFVVSHPYREWFLIFNEPPLPDGCTLRLIEDPIGAIYLTNPPKPSQAGNEIGIFISKAYRGRGYGKQAVRLLMKMHPAERLLANIAPGNAESIAMFEKLGFKLCQHTFEFND